MGEPISHKVEEFRGMIPRQGNQLLPNSASQEAFNCRLLSGYLEGIRQLYYVQDLRKNPIYLQDNAPMSAFPVGNTSEEAVWRPFEEKDVHFVRGPLTNDAYNRYYWTGDGPPKYNTEERIRNGDADLLLGVPAPINSLGVAPAGGDPQAARAYVYTFVSPLGEEGPPCAPTVATGGEGTWTLTGFDATIPDMGRRYPGQWKIRVYRTVAGGLVSTYHYVDEFDLGGVIYYDNQASDVVVLNSALESADWEPPPEDLDHLIVHPNGFLVGFVGTDVFMSVPFRPHAWPKEYVLSTEFPIIALGVFGQSIAVATSANPYILSGSAPLSMTFTKTNSVMPCLSRYSLVNYDFGVVYASERGLVIVDGVKVDNLTNELILGDEWKETYRPGQILAAARYDQQYLAFLPSSDAEHPSRREGFLFSPRNPLSAWSRVDQFTYVDSLIVNELDGKLYVIRGGVLYEWDNFKMPRVQYRWKSKVFDFPKPVNWGAARISMDIRKVEIPNEDIVEFYTEFNQLRVAFPLAPIGNKAFGLARDYDIPTPIVENKDPAAGSALRKEELGLNAGLVLFLVWADDELVFSTLAEAGELLPLPVGFKAERWQFEVRAYSTIRSVEFGSSPKALARV